MGRLAAEPAPRPSGRPPSRREVYIDAFRGLMALVMVQGHLCETLLTPELRADPVYRFQVLFHGSTAPGFLFASGFVAGLPRAPLSLTAAVRRARRLLFVLGLGYALHLPYLSLWKTVEEATPAELRVLFAADALQTIAVTQLLVLYVQRLAGRRWVWVAAALAVAILALGPLVWSSGVSSTLPPWLGAYLDRSHGSMFPVFPFSATVLAGTVAGAHLGRQDRRTRGRRSLRWGLGLLAAGAALSWALWDEVWFWGVSPGYALLRLGALVLLLRGVESAAARGWPGIGELALLGHETLLVYVLHLYLLFGWLFGPAPFGLLAGRLGFGGALFALLGMLPMLFYASRLWHAAKVRAPHEAQLALVFVSTLFVWEFLTRPW